MKRHWIILSALCIVLLGILVGSQNTLSAQAPARPQRSSGSASPDQSTSDALQVNGEVSLGFPTTTAFTYHGKLSEGGVPANGSYDFIFQLYDAFTGGAPVGSDVVKSNVSVKGGLFTVALDFGADAFQGEARFLEISVRPAEIIFWTTLSPRQPLRATPYALGLRPGAVISGTAYQNLKVVSRAPAGGNPAAVTGEIYTSDGVGVFARNYNTSGTNYGLWAVADSQSGYAVFAEENSGGVGVQGTSKGYGGTFGVKGISEGLDGVGVIGLVDAENAIGVDGRNPSGMGVRGLSTGGAGVQGQSTNGIGVEGISHGSQGIGVHGTDDALTTTNVGVQGDSAVGVGVKGTSTASTGVAGTSTNGSGVVGINSTFGEVAAGVRGVGQHFGVYGESTNFFGIGVAGYAMGNGTGVRAYSDSGTALIAHSRTGLAAEIQGTAQTTVLQIVGGSDLAEHFAVGDDAPIEPGTLLVIDAERPGRLKVSSEPYDSKVAGIASGAGGVNPGLTLQQQGVLEGNTLVAISGRAYVKAEAHSGPIKPGDLLTSSAIPGYAMKAADRERAPGAVIGKAMSGLDSGTGLVLVLVNLQ